MIKNKKLRIAIASVVMALIYPLIFMFLFAMEAASGDSTDAAGWGYITLGIYIEGFMVSVVYFIISIIFSRIFLRTLLPPFIVLLLLLLGYGISLIPDYIKTLPSEYTEYYEDGKVKQVGKKEHSYDTWVGWVKSYRRDGTIWKEEQFPSIKSDNRLIYAKYYYEDGTLKSEGYTTFDNLAHREGEWKFYKPDGTLDDIRNYDENAVRLNSSEKYQLYTDGVKIYRVGSGKLFTGTLSNTPVVYVKNYSNEFPEAFFPRENEDDEEEIFPDLYTCRVKNGLKQDKVVIRYATHGHPIAYQTVIYDGGNSWAPANVYYPNGQIQDKVTILDDSTRRYDCYYQDSIKRRPHGVLRFKVKYRNDDAIDTAYWYNSHGKLRAWAVFKDGDIVKHWPEETY